MARSHTVDLHVHGRLVLRKCDRGHSHARPRAQMSGVELWTDTACSEFLVFSRRHRYTADTNHLEKAHWSRGNLTTRHYTFKERPAQWASRPDRYIRPGQYVYLIFLPCRAQSSRFFLSVHIAVQICLGETRASSFLLAGA